MSMLSYLVSSPVPTRAVLEELHFSNSPWTCLSCSQESPSPIALDTTSTSIAGSLTLDVEAYSWPPGRSHTISSIHHGGRVQHFVLAS